MPRVPAHVARCLADLRTSMSACSVRELDELAAELALLRVEVRNQKYERGAASCVLLSHDLVGRIMMQHLRLDGWHKVGASVCKAWRDAAATVMSANAMLAESPWCVSRLMSLAWQSNGESVAGGLSGVEPRSAEVGLDANARTFTAGVGAVVEAEEEEGWEESEFDFSSVTVVTDSRPGHSEVFVHQAADQYIVKAMLEEPPDARVLGHCLVNEPAHCGEVAMACENGLLYVLDRFHAVRVK